MARKGQTTPQDPEVDQSRAERDLIEGQKNTLQTEVIGIAKNKKELEENFEDAKKVLEAEFEKKKGELDAEIKKLQDECVVWRREQQQAKKEAGLAVQLRDAHVKDEEAHRIELDAVKQKKSEVTISHVTLVKEKDILQSDIHILTREVSDLQKSKDTLVKEIADFTEKDKELSKALAYAAKMTAFKEEELKKLTDEYGKIASEIVDLDKKVGSTKETISKLNSEIVDLQKKKAEVEQAMAKRESEINDRMGNLTRLEQRIDEKQALLIRYKEKFSTDELAKIKANI